jgi:iron(III) transport system substrate-binding protein
VFQRIGQEMDSRIYACDVVNTADAAHCIVWKRHGWLAPYLPEEVARHFPAEHHDADGLFVTTRIWLSSIGYNTDLVKAADAPKSFADLLLPKWTGRMVKAHPSYSGTIMTATFQIVRELGWEYLEKLSKQRIMQVQSSTDPPKKLALGERMVMADGNDYNIVQLKRQASRSRWSTRPKAPRSSPVRPACSSRRQSERGAALSELAALARRPAAPGRFRRQHSPRPREEKPGRKS